jgi:hypothetical protein
MSKPFQLAEWGYYALIIPCAYAGQVVLERFVWHKSTSFAIRDDASFEVTVAAVVLLAGRLLWLATRKPVQR